MQTKEDDSWMYDGVTAMLQSEDFQRPIKQFVDTNCSIFSEEVRSALRERFVVSDRDPVQDENHHEHTKIHAQFCELLESNNLSAQCMYPQ